MAVFIYLQRERDTNKLDKWARETEADCGAQQTVQWLLWIQFIVELSFQFTEKFDVNKWKLEHKPHSLSLQFTFVSIID